MPRLRRVSFAAGSLILALALVGAAVHTRAAEEARTGQGGGGNDQRPCAAREFRQLDFRLGAFNVKTASGIQAGHDQVDSILSGCGIVEHWTGAVSGRAQSLTVFDLKDGHWHMLFANDTGNVLRLTGTFAGSALVLTGENYTFDGRYGLHRMSWSPLPAGGIRQLWELSLDQGQTWREIFDGRFTRMP